MVNAIVDVGPPALERLTTNQRARRDRIVHAARDLLEHSEYDRIQMRDIADESNVALGTVYRYFASKEHLFAAVLVEWSDSLHFRVQRRPLSGTTPDRMLDDLMGRVLNAFDRYPQFLRVIVLLDNTPDVFARELHAEFSSHTESTFLDALDGVAPDDAEAVISVVKAVLWTSLRAWSHGLITIKQAKGEVSRCIDLIFSVGPKFMMKKAPN